MSKTGVEIGKPRCRVPAAEVTRSAAIPDDSNTLVSMSCHKGNREGSVDWCIDDVWCALVDHALDLPNGKTIKAVANWHFNNTDAALDKGSFPLPVGCTDEVDFMTFASKRSIEFDLGAVVCLSYCKQVHAAMKHRLC